MVIDQICFVGIGCKDLVGMGSRSGPISCESWREFFKKENNFLGANLERPVSPAGEMFWSGLLTPSLLVKRQTDNTTSGGYDHSC